MTYLERIRAIVRQQSFQPSALGLITNPAFIIRSGLHRCISELAPEISGHVLDFGCGSKPYENLFVNASEYWGCDIRVSGHDHQDSKIDCYYDGKRLPFGSNEFDAVISFETFEHIFNLAEILKEINRVTKPSGHLLISIPFAWDEHEAPYDFARYTSFGIASVLSEGGYKVIKTLKTTTYLLAVFQMLIAYFSQHVAPKNRLRHPFQLFFLFPLALTAYALNAVFPKRYQYFCNIVLLAQKI